MQTKSKPGLALLLLCVFTSVLSAQVARLEPAKPQVGQTLTITYNPKATGAKLTLNEDIYAVGITYFPERQPMVFKLRKAGEVYQHTLKVAADWGYINFFFLSLNASDRQQKVGTMIYRADGQPVRNGWLGKMLGEDTPQAEFQSLFQQEIALYPDNFAAYISKWELAQRHKIPDADAQVKKDLALIAQQPHDQSVDYLYVQATSAMQAMAADRLLAIAEKMTQTHPDAPLTVLIVDRVVRGAQQGYFKGDAAKTFERIQWERLQRQPTAISARDHLQAFAWKADSFTNRQQFPLSVLEQIANAWITAEPVNPFPYNYLSTIYADRQQKTAEAAALIEKAIGLYQTNHHRLFMNSGKIIETQSLLADAHLTSAELHYRMQKFAEAYLRVKAAQTHRRESTFKETDSKSYELEGRILQAQNSLSMAERAYATAWLNGSDDAERGLRAIYEKRNGKAEGFPAYLRQKRDSLASNETPPGFNVTSLAGQKLDLASLKGKVVVLNFWFIGCPPCIAEMPGLNQLVAEFKDKDVVFIAFARDQEKELREFLPTKPFHYQVIANAETQHDLYQLNMWPTHIIINREGKVAQRLIGGGMNRHEELRRLLNRVLY